jgi:hypothetical protein
MSQPNDNDSRPVKAADVKTGDHVFNASGAPVEVTHIQPFTRRGAAWLLIVTADGDSTEWDPGDTVHIVSRTKLALLREAAERPRTIAAFRDYLDWMESHPGVPLPYLRHQQAGLDGDWEDRLTTVTRVAEALGVRPVFETHGGREIAKLDYRIGEISYCLYTSREKPADDITDAAPRGTDAAEEHAPKPATVQGLGHTRGKPDFVEEPADEADEAAAAEAYGENELDHDRIPTREGFEESQRRKAARPR